MTDGAFGKRAQNLLGLDRLHEVDSDSVDDEVYVRLAKLLRVECWPEIIQLYEAAQHQHDLGEARPALCAALSALDKKAEEMS